MTRSRRAGLSRDEARRQPLYARMLGLQYLAPSGFLCFVFLEGAIALGILLALAELVSWWGVLVLPVTVAVMVKLNDAVAGALTRASTGASRPASGGPGAGAAGRASRGRRSAAAGHATDGRQAAELGVVGSGSEFRSAALGDAGHGTALAEAGLSDLGFAAELADAGRRADVNRETGFSLRDDDGVGGSGVYASTRAKPGDGGATRRMAASTGSGDATQRLSRRRAPGVQTVRLPPSVIEQAAQDAGHDQSAYGTWATDRPVTPEPARDEPGIDLSTQELDRFPPGQQRRFAPEPDDADPFPADRGRFSAEPVVLAPEAESFAPEAFTPAPLAPGPFTPAPLTPEPFTPAPPLSPEPFAREDDYFTAAPDPFAPEGDRFTAAADPFSSEPYPLRPGYGDPASTGAGAVPDGSAGLRRPSERRRRATHDDYLPPLAGELHSDAAGELRRHADDGLRSDAAGELRSGTAATEPDLFPTADPSAFPIDPSAINGPRAATPWPAQLDDQDQRTRQSASRRYE